MKELRIWLDDMRDLPIMPSYRSKDEWWNIHCKTAESAIWLIKGGNVRAISFDHDLGTKKNGYDVAKFIEKQAALGILDKIDYLIHSGNPVDSQNIDAAMKSAHKYWEKKENRKI